MNVIVDPRELESYLHEKIPLTRAMGVRVERVAADGVVLAAPLGPNHNHMGTAFGGSLAALATLAGYCVLWVALGDRDGHIVVKRGEMDYRRPVTGDIRAECRAPVEALAEFRARYAAAGKARLTLEAVVAEQGETCAVFAGEFVALGRVPGRL